jgi:hypothetical protein
MSIDQQPVQTPVPATSKNWFARHKVLTGIGAVCLVAGIGSAAAGTPAETAAQKGSATSTKAKSETKPVTAKTETTKTEEVAAPVEAGGPSASFPKVDGDWRLDSVKISKQDFTGSFEGRARITYIGDDSGGGDNAFTITVFKAGDDVGSLIGFANTVMPGQTKTVDLISSDDYVSGANKYDFQNNW